MEILEKIRQLNLAVSLVKLGCRKRMVLDNCPRLSTREIKHLYLELQGKSPSRGQYKYTFDWCFTYSVEARMALFLGFYSQFKQEDINSFIIAYKKYVNFLEKINVKNTLTPDNVDFILKGMRKGNIPSYACDGCGRPFHSPGQHAAPHLCALCRPFPKTSHKKLRIDLP